MIGLRCRSGLDQIRQAPLLGLDLHELRSGRGQVGLGDLELQVEVRRIEPEEDLPFFDMLPYLDEPLDDLSGYAKTQ
jgi:hypothetical protein